MPDAHVTIRDLTTLEEYQECCEIQEETWGRGFSERVPAAILRVSQKIGGVTAGAFTDQGRMVGFVFGMTGVRDGRLAHWSDMLAVREEARGHHLGDQLKHYQREKVRAIGVEVMFWTFDPLVARNAHFNINRLGARPVEYVVDMYGSNTGSSLHGKMPTDRLVIGWELDKGYTPTAGMDAPRNGDESAPLVNPVSSRGTPLVALTDGAPTVRVQVPHDSSALRATDEERVLEWRYAVREAFCHYLGHGYQVNRFVRRGNDALPYYVFSRSQ
jgi:predicted GNAT superfamily acetyltransferase